MHAIKNNKVFKYICLFLLTAVVLSYNNNIFGLTDNVKQNSQEAIILENEMGTAFEPVTTDKRMMIDDFEDGDLNNRLNGNSGAWNLEVDEEYSSCTPAVIDMKSPEVSKKVLKLTYDVKSPNRAQNGYWTKLMDIDVSKYDHIEFFVKGDEKIGFTSTFKLEIKKYKDDKRTDKLTGSYVVTGINSGWQRISIPLNKFNAIREWNHIEELVIIFHDRLCDIKEGTLYFDNFKFVKTGHPGPSAFDFRGSSIRKSREKYNKIEWARWLANRLHGFPSKLYVKKKFPDDNREFLLEVARDTWRFFDDIIDNDTHLPLDTICFSKNGIFGEGGYVGDYTNVTNIGLYLMCLIAAYDFKFIDKEETLKRINNTLTTIESLETYRHFLYNYYDTTTAERTSNFVSVVDSGWLAAGIYIIKNAFPESKNLSLRCGKLLKNWDFSFFYDEIEQLFFHGFYTNNQSYSNYHYGTFYSESRISSYLAVAKEDIPLHHWTALNRTLPENYTWQQQIPINRKEKIFHGIPYFGGYYELNGIHYIPSWGGSLFEALMPTLLLKEKEIAPTSIGLNNKRHAQIHASYALENLGLPIWGMSPCSVPEDGYSEYGVHHLGLKGYKDGIITPHATFLSLEYIPDQAIDNLRTMVKNYNVYGEYGFYDAVNPLTKKVALKYLCLDQAMILIALDNYLNNGAIQNRFHSDPVIQKGEYLLKDENLFD